MAIRERRRGVWQVRVYRGTDPVTGRRLWDSRTVHGTRRDARLVEAAMLTEQGGHGAHRGIVTEVLDQVIDHLEAFGRAPATIRNYRRLARKVGADLVGELVWADLRVRDVDA